MIEKTPKPHPHLVIQTGYTLIEVMIGVLIGLILTGSLIAILVNSTSSYNTQTDHMRVYENARFALDFLAKDIRMAGYFGCLNNSTNMVNNLNVVNGGLFDIDESLEGFENDGAETMWYPSGISVTGLNILAGSDAITIRFANPTELAKLAAPSSSSGIVDADSTATDHLFQTGNVVIISDCEQGDLFQITNANTDNDLSHTSGGNLSPGNTTGSLGANTGHNYSTVDTRIRSYNAVRYYVRQRDPSDADADATVALYRQYVSSTGGTVNQELVEGVENLQILYGVDSDSDGIANSYLKANVVNPWADVVSVQLGLLLRSNEEYGSRDKEDSAYVHTLLGETITDSGQLRVRRHEFSTTIALRN